MLDDQGVPPDRFAPEPIVSEIGAVPDREYAPFSFDEEHDMLIFQFSREEFVKVLSSLRNGSYMTYGNEGSAVYWSFLRNVDYPIMICASIIDCIMHDTDTQTAMRDQLLSDPAFVQQMQDKLSIGTSLPTGTGGTTAVLGENCDRDILWAGCSGVIQQMNRNNDDFLEKIAALTEPTDRVAHVLGLVPVLGSIAADVLDFVNTLFSGITTNYFAEYDTDYENEVTCQLFCLALESDTCAMKFDDIYNIFRNRLEASFTIESALLDVIQYLTTGTWSGTQVCDFMFMFQLQAIRSGNLFLTSTLLSLQTMFDVGAAVPSDAWIELCTDCPADWCIRLDAADDLEATFTPSGGAGPQAQWSGTGWQPNPSWQSRITIHGDLGITATITGMKVILSAPVTVGALQQVCVFTSGFGTSLACTPSTVTDCVLVFGATLQEFEIDVEADTLATGAAITSQIIAVEITGTGTAPSIGTVCA